MSSNILRVQPSAIKNKIKRREVYERQKAEKKRLQREAKKLREQEAAALGSAAPPKPVPKTLESLREWDDTVVDKHDPELLADEADDEFADIFAGRPPKIMMTTRIRPSGKIFDVLKELLKMFPRCFYYKRNNYPLKKICKWADNKNFTHLMVVGEKQKKVNSLCVIRLPVGPTAYFKLSNFKPAADISNHGTITEHNPEVLLNRFDTRLGRRLSRVFGSMFPPAAEFEGRRVVTFHNQRDYVFVRQHRYVFESAKKARLQELGPRFTLKLRWLLADTFNTVDGEYEWMHKRHAMDTSRRRFHL